MKGEDVKGGRRRLLKCSCCGRRAREMAFIETNVEAKNETYEVSLDEGGPLLYEEARALLAKLEYEKGNISGALHVLEGIDVASATPKIITGLSDVGWQGNSVRGPALFLQGMFLKAKSLKYLGRLKEAANSCQVILDILESSFPQGFPDNFDMDGNLRTTVSESLELLPELWKNAGFFAESVVAYRRVVSRYWGFSDETLARLELELCVSLLYGGHEAVDLKEAIELLATLLRKGCEGVVDWDAAVLDHLCFALAVCSETKTLAALLEMLVPGIVGPREGLYLLGVSYYAAGDGSVALNLLKKLLREDPENVPALLLAAKISGDTSDCGEGIEFCERALRICGRLCPDLESLAMFLLGISLSCAGKSSVSHRDKAAREAEALQALECALRMGSVRSAEIVYRLAVENARQMKLTAARGLARELLDLEKGSDLRGWLLLSKVLSAQKELDSADLIVTAALDQTGASQQAELLRMKAKLHLAKGEVADAIQIYTLLLASLKIHGFEGGRLEAEVWHDLALVYISLCRWSDAETCIANSNGIGACSAARIHVAGVLSKKKGLTKEGLKQFLNSMDVDPTYVPSLMAAATTIRELGDRSNAVVKNLLMESLRQDRSNWLAWHNLGFVYRDEGGKYSSVEAANCFQAAILFQESASIDPF